MMRGPFFFLILVLSLFPSPADSLGLRLPRTESSKYLTQEEHWFHQTLDHFSPTDHRQFKQRYYEFLDNHNLKDGPIFLRICGESTCPGIANDYLSVLSKKFGAALVSLEHRYYGKSSPFESLTTENLRFLSSKQALFDLAVFRQYYQESLNVKYNRSKVESPWFVFGVSYSGALSAWFQLKFPHLTCGSLASSAVVLAVYNFTEFDKQVGESAGVQCKPVLQEITALTEEQLQSDGKAVKDLFGAAKLDNDVDFLYLLADAAALAFQYGNPDVLCSPLIDAKKTGKNLVEAYAAYVKNYYLGSFGASVQSYDRKHLKNTSVGEEVDDRLWWFQVCSEVAYFQVAPKNDSVRSAKIDTRAKALAASPPLSSLLEATARSNCQGINPAPSLAVPEQASHHCRPPRAICLSIGHLRSESSPISLPCGPRPDPAGRYCHSCCRRKQPKLPCYSRELPPSPADQQPSALTTLAVQPSLQDNKHRLVQIDIPDKAITVQDKFSRYHLDLCRNIFGEGVYPDVYITNIYYGGTGIAGSKIIFTNGSQDPWRHASKQKSSEDMPSYIIDCHNCGHGSDLRGCPQLPFNIEGNAKNCSSSEAVQKVRQKIIEQIDLWLSKCQSVTKAHYDGM